MQSSQELVLMIMQPENVKLLIEAVLGQLFMSWFIDDLKPFNPVTLLRLRVCDCLLGLLCRLPPDLAFLAIASPAGLGLALLYRGVRSLYLRFHKSQFRGTDRIVDKGHKLTARRTRMLALSGKRHNSHCRYYGHPGSRSCGNHDGWPCKLCGG
jgi:hypothetical protein